MSSSTRSNSRWFGAGARRTAWVALALFVSLARAADFWVAPNGDDRDDGTKDHPLASIATAQRKARELRRLTGRDSSEDATKIVLRGGVYRLTSPLQFRAEDSGREKSPTLVAAAPGEQPVLSGGFVVGNRHKPSTAIVGLPAVAANNVWVADAPRLGGLPLACRQLWVDDRKAVRARSPNGPAMARLQAWDRPRQLAGIPSDLVPRTLSPTGVEFVVAQQWEVAVLRVRAFRSDGAQTWVEFMEPESRLEFSHPWPQPILPPKGGGVFFLTGTVDFLDEPGEWAQESPSGRLIYWPRDGEDLARSAVVVPNLETLVEVSGSLDRPVGYVEFQGITFSHTGWRRPGEAGHVPLQAGMPLLEAYALSPPGTPDRPRLENQAWIGRLPAAVTVKEADHVVFSRCRFEHLAAGGLDLARGVHDGVVEGCAFRDVGGNGLQLGKFSDPGVETHVPYAPTDEREVCARVRIANNLVTNCANEDWGAVGIVVGYGREITIEHNEVCDVSYTGISVGWGWTPAKNALRDNRVHANYVHHVATRLCDTAGIYTLSAQPGTVVSENRIEAIAMSPYVDRPDHWFYLYTDEGSSFITVRDNWCPAEKFLQNATGPGNRWERNGPQVPETIKAAAGIEPAIRDQIGRR